LKYFLTFKSFFKYILNKDLILINKNMILSTNVIDKENDDNDSSSDSSIKDEGLTELKNIMDNNKKSNYIIYLFL